ncbi:MAG: FHA domain-containing protein [Phycisphaerae bacterium]|nr:FHA domain-containing protein [Phycisphaerae bacterium]
MPSLWIVGSTADSLRVLSQATTLVARNLHDPTGTHLALADPAVSEPIKGEREGHAAVSHESGAFFVRDLGSTNGTHIALDDDAMMRLAPGQKWRLADGQIFVCGGTAIVFRVRDDAPDADEVMKRERKLEQVRRRAGAAARAPWPGDLSRPTLPLGRR